MSKAYEIDLSEHLRITILRLLDEYNGILNESLLSDMVLKYGFTPSFDKLRTELSWLEEQGLIKCSGHECIVATLTRRGEDVAKCRVTVPGVKRPSRR
jgi:repressor of nif and glnA expression